MFHKYIDKYINVKKENAFKKKKLIVLKRRKKKSNQYKFCNQFFQSTIDFYH